MQLFDIAAITVAAAAATITAVLWVLKGQKQALLGGAASEAEPSPQISFLFDNDSLQHVSEPAGRLYQLIPGRDDWTGLREKLLNRFPTIPVTPTAADGSGLTIPAREASDPATLLLTRDGQFTRVAMMDEVKSNLASSERITQLRREIDDLKRASDTTSHAIWQQNQQNTVTWHNAAYEQLCRKLHNGDPDPKRPVFDGLDGFDIAKQRQRVSAGPPGAEDWYDVSAVTLANITVFHAVNVNAIVKSEVAQRNFVQTLAKTFAQLSIGLAIFDRNGQLALFNPALIDLTELPADFLSGRPTLMSFFDRIRENRRMPEPKNYRSWRQQIAEVIAAATDGRYQETWTLETGQTYRVNGRPHPDGAIAFLIEDISAEISLTRNFRAELELGQSLMDSFGEALVVFSSSGVLAFCNLAYRDMWGMDPDNSFADVSIHDCVALWRDQCDEDAGWDEIVDFVMDYGEQRSWEMTARRDARGELTCTVSRIATGATILRFENKPVPPKTAAQLTAATNPR